MKGRYALPVLIALAHGTAQAATIAPPENLHELAQESDLVVLAEALESRAETRGAAIFTLTTFRVERTVVGPARPGSTIEVRAPGGEAGGRRWSVPGSPRFTPGLRYLLCLRERDDGAWLPLLLAYGTLREARGAGGKPAVLLPLPEAASVEVLPLPDGTLAEAVVPYYRDALLDHLSDCFARSSSWDARTVEADPADVPIQGAGGGIPSACRFFTSGGRRFRWEAFDAGRSAIIFADVNGDRSLPGGGFDEVAEALDVWMDIPEHRLNLVFGGTREPNPDCGDGGARANTIIFNDPCSEIANLEGCGGILAFGGPLASGTHVFDGDRWITITGWIVVTNDGTGCLGPDNWRRMVAHELGHGLGFGHVDDSGALMYQSCCNDPNTTDVRCLRATYPARDPANRRPEVDAGPDVDLTLAGNTLRLSGSASDDGLPAPGSLDVSWRRLHGPGTVTFSARSSLSTEVSFSRSGTYLLGLTVNDGDLIRTDAVEVSVEIMSAGQKTIVFQQGVGGYLGAADTMLQENAVSANNSLASELSVDGDDPGGSGLGTQALLRFGDLFGAESGRIPPGAGILSATLELTVTNPGDGAALYRMAEEWSDADSWNSFEGNGIQPGIESLAEADALTVGSGPFRAIDVTESLSAWSEDPCSNHGWVFLPRGSNGWDFFSTEGNEPPRLAVSYEDDSGPPLIEAGSEWSFLRGVAAPPSDWREPDFDDSAWERGPAGIGYGDGDDLTVLEDMQGSYLTVFLRRGFDAPELEDSEELVLTVIHDDGVAVHLNGTELGRAVMPAGPVTNTTAASRTHEAAATTFRIPKDRLLPGANVIAASVHNAGIDSSDLSFDAVLSKSRKALDVDCDGPPAFVFRRGDVSGNGSFEITDAIRILDFLFRGEGEIPCPDTADADDDGSLSVTDAVRLLGHLFQGSAAPPAPGRECGADPTPDELGECASTGCAG